MSIIWTLRKYIDSVEQRREEAEQERDRRLARRQAQGDGDGEAAGAAAGSPPRRYRCRVCGHRSGDDAYCPECLAATMVEVAEDESGTAADDEPDTSR